jgi:glycosyltransferase involved in cell wall biosynthesis
MVQRQADVVFTLFAVSWAFAVRRGLAMPEDRLAMTLVDHPRVRRLLIGNPYRPLAGRVRGALRGESRTPLLARERSRIYEPLRLRRGVPPDTRRAVARYEAGLRRNARRLGLERPAIITASPVVAGFGAFEWAGPVTYYAWDDWTAAEPLRASWPAFDEAFGEIRRRGRRVVAVSDAALRRVDPTGAAAVVPNGIQLEEWLAPGEPPEWFAGRPRPRLLYVGSLDGRVDVEQVRAIAAAHPGGSVTFVGSLLDPAHLAGLWELPNVTLHPQVPREEIVRVIAAADACLIPHVRNRLTEAMSPLKLFEYLAGGRPVAAVDLPPIAATEGRVALGPPGGDLRPAVERALAMGPAPEPERLAFVREHDWARRFEQLLDVALADG